MKLEASKLIPVHEYNRKCKITKLNTRINSVKQLIFPCNKKLFGKQLQQIKIVPKRKGTIFEIQYIKTIEEKNTKPKPKRLMGIAVVTNVPGLKPCDALALQDFKACIVRCKSNASK